VGDAVEFVGCKALILLVFRRPGLNKKKSNDCGKFLMDRSDMTATATIIRNSTKSKL